MEKLEKYSLDTIIATLKQCAGIKICVICPSYQSSGPHYDYICHQLNGLVSIYNSYDLRLKNNSEFTVIPETRASLLRGRRYHQIFLDKRNKDSFIETVAISAISSRLNSEPLFKTGVFALFDELDEVKRAAAKVISDFSCISTLSELNVALENAKKLVQEVTR